MSTVLGEFINLAKIQSTKATIKLAESDADTIKEIQTLLKKKGLYTGGVDGITGDLTQKAFAEFKESVWLDSPELLGASAAAALLEIAEEHQVTEQNERSEPIPESSKGSKTGSSMKLPNGTIVYENELIVIGIPLTWGEFTKGCTRVPESNAIATNIIKATKGFGKIRDQYGSAIQITSGYRPPAVNREQKGARNSQHIQGLAIDLAPLDGNLQRLFQVCRASDCTGLGRGMHRGFVHCDWRPGDRVVFDYP
ncbi:D-Ala-D-Ala carboxypeptidase family metallohydrolase [Nostoc sp.]|uniref:D-Ala-D-Ala carboxypeptidase family metallohydrolase n=1 Tax=Nostoc sp. TaxID=1180 RepID=UPI002FFAE6C0